MSVRLLHSLLFIASLLLAATARANESTLPDRYRVGELDRDDFRETSGLARSLLDPDRFWLLGDGGSGAVILAIDRSGMVVREVPVSGATNVDWEDMAALRFGGEAALLIADIGDNEGARPYLTLYVVPEPGRNVDAVAPVKTIRFRFPGGPRDAEAVAVVPGGNEALILTKRSVPAELYAVPLDASGKPVVARSLGAATGLPQPDRDDLDLAMERQSWHWQPTAMDVSADGEFLAVLTYAAAYLLPVGPDWPSALSAVPSAHSLGGLANAESLAFDGDAVLVTAEGRRAPVYCLPLSGFRAPATPPEPVPVPPP